MNQQNIQTHGKLFELAQQQAIFKDCKTFVDCIPRHSPAKITEALQQLTTPTPQDLAQFIRSHFHLPSITSEVSQQPYPSMQAYIEHMWQALARPADEIQASSTLLALPHPYLIPGGRFREIYYWDSYFTAEGLAASGHTASVENFVKNFAYLIEQVGHIPNGNRTYYTSRSQPPFFVCLLDLLEKLQGWQSIQAFIPHLETEYRFWMQGSERLNPQHRAEQRVVMLDTQYYLNRYWDNQATPRPESYREDSQLSAAYPGLAPSTLYRNIRAACESGWDFSSRWFADQQHLASIQTTQLIPVDLNCILFHMESRLSEHFSRLGDMQKSTSYQQAAQQRRDAIQRYCWDNKQQFYFDYHWQQYQHTPTWSLAAVYPLFFGVATATQAQAVAQHLQQQFLHDGGLVTTLADTGQQWDSPNGWAPLHWLAIQGLQRYGLHDLAREVKHRWLNTNQRIWQKTGKMLEKYNVVNPKQIASGGEYQNQDGFGWTNGIAAALLK
jgi:alpha,alpha-trehalase